MTYRDDEQAMQARLAALERRVARVDQLERRVVELEDENRRLRAAAANAPARGPVAASTSVSVDGIFIAEPMLAYVEALLAATRNPAAVTGLEQLATAILSGVSPDYVGHVVQAGKQRAHEQGRTYVTPEDIKRVTETLLPSLVILTRDAEAAGTDAASLVQRILEVVEVP